MSLPSKITTPKAGVCTHELWERESACADGMCPLCAAARIGQLERELAASDERYAGALGEIAALSNQLATVKTDQTTIVNNYERACEAWKSRLATVAQAERERCAQVCEHDVVELNNHGDWPAAQQCKINAAEIRALALWESPAGATEPEAQPAIRVPWKNPDRSGT